MPVSPARPDHAAPNAAAAPTVAWHAPDDPARPLVVLLHGRGADETSILGLADHLPAGPSYAAVRAPIAEGAGYAWFANRGIGRPVAESLARTMAWFRAWLDGVAPAGRPVVLVGFSGGAAFAGGLLLSTPERFAGAAILYGTLPFDAGVPVTPARLAGVPVFVAQGDADTVIPRELLDRTWDYLLGDAGAPPYARRDPGGHGLTAGTLAELGGWVAERLTFLARREPAAPGPAGTGPAGTGPATPGPAAWPTLPGGVLPARRGKRPRTTWRIPQQQLTDTSPPALQERLFARVAALPGVTTRPSAISVPGARGFLVTPGAGAPADAFLVPHVGEFAHLHPGHDGSLHLALPPALAADAVARGWAVAHPLAGVRLARGMVMVYGPRDDAELDVVAAVVETSHRYATGGLDHCFDAR
ncbi:alpha/beta hydrolase [Isoptericola variabilis]|uniref:Phospholipase/Carboxylesterase n=1 Tax=Isoptericola variabilis (strain 225) TaxID=743718 RepID=F6FRQ9_ISOV2|nr:luciferase family protein [Isoptericola variabilis]AEG43000.1 phospholipase/Carboxylesterase [Isoptericola variabilis 225]TWH30106.1 phospholipase/carboxylesterase [Isoptericola variabilis J7]